MAQPVLDLTDAETRARYGVSLETLRGDGDAAYEACRAIADLARAQGYNAILSPSAAAQGEKNLTIYLDGRPADLRLIDGPDREPLNY